MKVLLLEKYFYETCERKGERGGEIQRERDREREQERPRNPSPEESHPLLFVIEVLL